MKRNRLANTGRNAVFSFFDRAVTMLCSFAARSVFLSVLDRSYLGVGGMFGNVFTVLALLECGIGTAISQTLYKPLAAGHFHIVKALVNYHERLYRRVSLATLTVSAALLPFLPRLFPDIVRIDGYRAVYALFVFHQLCAYRFAPKRALVVCDQRMYAVVIPHTVCTLLATVCQIAVLRFTGSYLAYLALRIGFAAVEGMAVEWYAAKVYPFLKSHAEPLSAPLRALVKDKARALFVHRVGGVVDRATDSLLISAKLGLASMGVFSNYALVINTVGGFVSLGVRSCAASVGNLSAGENEEKGEAVLKRLCFLNVLAVSTVTSVFAACLRPFFSLWVGEGMCFGNAETAVILGCFYLSYVRDPVRVFLENYGVFEETKYLYLFRGCLNFALSLVFVGRYGVTGVFGGTVVSTLVTALPFEPVFALKYALHRPVLPFMRYYLGLVGFGALAASFPFCAGVFLPIKTLPGLIVSALVTAVTVPAAFYLRYHRSAEWHDGTELLRLALNKVLRRVIKKRSLGGTV